VAIPEGQLRRIPRCYDFRELCELEHQRHCCHDLYEHKYPCPYPQHELPNQAPFNHGRGHLRTSTAAMIYVAVAATGALVFHGLKQQLGQWDGSGCHHFICIDKTHDGPTCEEQQVNMACMHARDDKSKSKNKTWGMWPASQLG